MKEGIMGVINNTLSARHQVACLAFSFKNSLILHNANVGPL